MSVRMWFLLGIIAVTACEGCVDWNIVYRSIIPYPFRHSLRGLCGLKFLMLHSLVHFAMSQPARAVWIEITCTFSLSIMSWVTACEGCVDWNSAWRLEILSWVSHSLRGLCGLKFPDWIRNGGRISHSLRGLCGLKYCKKKDEYMPTESQPARAVWIEISWYSG